MKLQMLTHNIQFVRRWHVYLAIATVFDLKDDFRQICECLTAAPSSFSGSSVMPKTWHGNTPSLAQYGRLLGLYSFHMSAGGLLNFNCLNHMKVRSFMLLQTLVCRNLIRRHKLAELGVFICKSFAFCQVNLRVMGMLLLPKLNYISQLNNFISYSDIWSNLHRKQTKKENKAVALICRHSRRRPVTLRLCSWQCWAEIQLSPLVLHSKHPPAVVRFQKMENVSDRGERSGASQLK